MLILALLIKLFLIVSVAAALMGATIEMANAQQSPGVASVVPSCGSAAYVAGTTRPVTQDTGGNQCSSATGGGGSTVTAQGSPVTITDGSGAITTGGTSQQIFAANTSRKYLFVENPSATVSGVAAENCFVNIGANASNAGTSYELTNLGAVGWENNAIPTGTVNITCPTSGHRYIAKYGQ